MKSKKRANLLPQSSGQPDYLLAMIVLALTLFGVLMVYDTSIIIAHREFGDKYWFLKNQGIWAFIGISAGYFVSHIDYRIWKKLAKPIYIAAIVLLILVLVPGVSATVYGARRRLSFPTGIPILGHISVQPAEIAKFAVVFYLASWLSDLFGTSKAKVIKRFETVIPFLSTVGIIIGLIMLEPDLGSSLIVGGSALFVYFLAGVPLIDIFLVGVIALITGVFFAFSSEYRRNRIWAFLDPAQDQQGISYHINQILIALGSGGLFGLGLGHSRQKYAYIPEVNTDSIFAIIGEELGFMGAMLVLAALLIVIWRGFEIVERTTDMFGKLVAAGIVAIISVQTFLNLMSVVVITPLTGVPLPFISYGGSSLTMTLVGVGILLNISRQMNRN